MESLLIKLPKTPDMYNLKSVIQHYSSFAVTTDFCQVGTIEEQVLKIMQDIKSSKAAGIDKLSGRFLKDGAYILAKPVSALCDLSISRSVLPSAWKVVKLKPIFKKGKKNDPSNYRPTSLLPVISKINEKVVRDQTNAFFFSDENILYNYQYGFIAYHSTNKVLKRFDEGFLTGMILSIFRNLLIQ